MKNEKTDNSEYKEVPNMDCMFLDDLEAYYQTILLKEGDIWAKIRTYAYHKIIAMRNRLSGDVNVASRNEKICDGIYQDIKDYIDW